MIDFIFSNLGLLLFLLMVLLFACFKIAREGSRFAVFILGRYAGLKGPGFLFKWWSNETKWVHLNLGDSGELMDQQVGKFKEYNLTVLTESQIPIGSKIRITGFTEDKVCIVLAPDQRKSVTCDKCGHEISL